MGRHAAAVEGEGCPVGEGVERLCEECGVVEEDVAESAAEEQADESQPAAAEVETADTADDEE